VQFRAYETVSIHLCSLRIIFEEKLTCEDGWKINARYVSDISIFLGNYN